ncbi:NmrA family NAD(P)-binding protein [Kitasatospora cathayae]|uniref:NmrA family NAD(P)-binding protein n=1 Tax=Kitasatospora cathayae TaxID=3004092 RepID=A0ABY7Q7Z3_9ACTN|nr:NmrA family NAD(P)-binding protein [Kitasatospora sp. HUAS 3-15]WBP88702.1 NmrA family NAD(P)-binding protein [Kitasatospora sp. HUAS 3-15]
MTKVLVIGANGSVGRHVVASLVEGGHEVRALVRDTAKAAPPAGVETVRGDLAVPESLAAALGGGVEAVYLMWPGIPVQPRVVELIAEHARRVVYLSTDVPDLADDEPPVIFHQEIERLIRKSGLGWTFVRAIDFAGNTLGWADQVRTGVVRWPYGRARRSLVHERDIADVAVRALTEDGHDGAKYLVTGPESIAHADLARIIGEELGTEVRWEELAPETAREQLTAAWGNAAFVESRLAAWESFSREPERVTDTVEQVLGRPARGFRSWVREHAEDFR